MGKSCNKNDNLQGDNKELERADKIWIRIIHNRQGKQRVLASRISVGFINFTKQSLRCTNIVKLYHIKSIIINSEKT